MEKKVVSGTILTLMLIGTLTLAFNIQPVRASGTIYIRPDGTVEGTDKIQRDGDIYTFTGYIYDDGIVVEIDNIVIDGAGYTLRGNWPETYPRGIELTERSNVTIKNRRIDEYMSFKEPSEWTYSVIKETAKENKISIKGANSFSSTK